MCTHYRSSRSGRFYLYHRQVPTCRNWDGVQFITRSHRTALTESQVGSCATRHYYTLKVNILPRLITSWDIPGSLCNESSFCWRSSTKLQWWRLGGSNSHFSLERATSWPVRRRRHRYLLLRHHLFLSGLLPRATYLISITAPSERGQANRDDWMLESVVVERLNPCVRPLRIWIAATIGCRKGSRTPIVRAWA